VSQATPFGSPAAPRLSGNPPLLTIALVLANLGGWCVGAIAFQQSITAVQRSKWLLELGAINGDLLASQGWWRLLVSQFLHVQFLHMLFNVFCVALLGAALEKRYSWRYPALAFVAGGSIGQLASVLAYPDLVSTGASQALMSLCAVVVMVGVARHWKVLAAAVVLFQGCLDVYVAQTVKAGHLWGFVGGLVLGIIFTVHMGWASHPPPGEDARGDLPLGK
jgi:rhomboid protease GluP